MLPQQHPGVGQRQDQRQAGKALGPTPAGEFLAKPAVEVLFREPAGEWTPTFLLLDSGAAISVLLQGDATLRGIELKAGEPARVRGPSSKLLHGSRHRIRMRLQDPHRVCE